MGLGVAENFFEGFKWGSNDMHGVDWSSFPRRTEMLVLAWREDKELCTRRESPLQGERRPCRVAPTRGPAKFETGANGHGGEWDAFMFGWQAREREMGGTLLQVMRFHAYSIEHLSS